MEHQNSETPKPSDTQFKFDYQELLMLDNRRGISSRLCERVLFVTVGTGTSSRRRKYCEEQCTACGLNASKSRADHGSVSHG